MYVYHLCSFLLLPVTKNVISDVIASPIISAYPQSVRAILISRTFEVASRVTFQILLRYSTSGHGANRLLDCCDLPQIFATA